MPNNTPHPALCPARRALTALILAGGCCHIAAPVAAQTKSATVIDQRPSLGGVASVALSGNPGWEGPLVEYSLRLKKVGEFSDADLEILLKFAEREIGYRPQPEAPSPGATADPRRLLLRGSLRAVATVIEYARVSGALAASNGPGDRAAKSFDISKVPSRDSLMDLIGKVFPSLTATVTGPGKGSLFAVGTPDELALLEKVIVEFGKLPGAPSPPTDDNLVVVYPLQYISSDAALKLLTDAGLKPATAAKGATVSVPASVDRNPVVDPTIPRLIGTPGGGPITAAPTTVVVPVAPATSPAPAATPSQEPQGSNTGSAASSASSSPSQSLSLPTKTSTALSPRQFQQDYRARQETEKQASSPRAPEEAHVRDIIGVSETTKRNRRIKYGADPITGNVFLPPTLRSAPSANDILLTPEEEAKLRSSDLTKMVTLNLPADQTVAQRRRLLEAIRAIRFPVGDFKTVKVINGTFFVDGEPMTETQKIVVDGVSFTLKPDGTIEATTTGTGIEVAVTNRDPKTQALSDPNKATPLLSNQPLSSPPAISIQRAGSLVTRYLTNGETEGILLENTPVKLKDAVIVVSLDQGTERYPVLLKGAVKVGSNSYSNALTVSGIPVTVIGSPGSEIMAVDGKPLTIRGQPVPAPINGALVATSAGKLKVDDYDIVRDGSYFTIRRESQTRTKDSPRVIQSLLPGQGQLEVKVSGSSVEISGPALAINEALKVARNHFGIRPEIQPLRISKQASSIDSRDVQPVLTALNQDDGDFAVQAGRSAVWRIPLGRIPLADDDTIMDTFYIGSYLSGLANWVTEQVNAVAPPSIITATPVFDSLEGSVAVDITGIKPQLAPLREALKYGLVSNIVQVLVHQLINTSLSEEALSPVYSLRRWLLVNSLIDKSLSDAAEPRSMDVVRTEHKTGESPVDSIVLYGWKKDTEAAAKFVSDQRLSYTASEGSTISVAQLGPDSEARRRLKESLSAKPLELTVEESNERLYLKGPKSKIADVASLSTYAPAVQDQPLPANVPNLVLSGSPDDILHAVQLLRTVDVPPPQVAIEAIFLESNPQDMVERLGVHWADDTTGALFSTKLTEGSANKPLRFGTFTRDALTFNATVNALVQNRQAKILAQPNVTVMDRNTANIFVGDVAKFTVVTGFDAQGRPVLGAIDQAIGISLTVSPTVNLNDRRITLDLRPTISALQNTITPDHPFPLIRSRTVQTVARLEDGETFAIGGLIREDEQTSISRVPLLSSLPLVGELFRNRSHDKVRTELTLLIRPHLLYPKTDIATRAQGAVFPRIADNGIGTNITATEDGYLVEVKVKLATGALSPDDPGARVSIKDLTDQVVGESKRVVFSGSGTVSSPTQLVTRQPAQFQISRQILTSRQPFAADKLFQDFRVLVERGTDNTASTNLHLRTIPEPPILDKATVRKLEYSSEMIRGIFRVTLKRPAVPGGSRVAISLYDPRQPGGVTRQIPGLPDAILVPAGETVAELPFAFPLFLASDIAAASTIPVFFERNGVIIKGTDLIIPAGMTTDRPGNAANTSVRSTTGIALNDSYQRRGE